MSWRMASEIGSSRSSASTRTVSSGGAEGRRRLILRSENGWPSGIRGSRLINQECSNGKVALEGL